MLPMEIIVLLLETWHTNCICGKKDMQLHHMCFIIVIAALRNTLVTALRVTFSLLLALLPTHKRSPLQQLTCMA